MGSEVERQAPVSAVVPDFNSFPSSPSLPFLPKNDQQSNHSPTPGKSREQEMVGMMFCIFLFPLRIPWNGRPSCSRHFPQLQPQLRDTIESFRRRKGGTEGCHLPRAKISRISWMREIQGRAGRNTNPVRECLTDSSQAHLSISSLSSLSFSFSDLMMYFSILPSSDRML